MDSILTTIKKLIGIDEFDESFDLDVIVHINSAFSILQQIGVEPAEGFSITDDSTKWTDYIPSSPTLLGLVKTYIHLKVKLIFDPPPSSVAVESIKQMIAEHEWRIQEIVDVPATS